MTDRASVNGSVVVMGAARGIELAPVDALLRGGHLVVALDRDAEALSAAAKDRDRLRVLTVAGDVTDTGALRRALEEAASLAPLSGFVSNAGISSPGATIDEPRALWDDMLAIHLSAAFEGARAAAPADGQTSSAASYVTGTTVVVDVGWMAYGSTDDPESV
jgi:NAD(P)-dependent dehydrogenase (short-subunit alcohol dehydrogenase family)